MAMATMLLASCGIRSGYPNHVPTASLVEPGSSPHDNQDVYLQLIRKMQQQGAYYASLAHIDAYRLRYGSPPELRRLRADALRETGQDNAAAAVYRGLLHSDQAAAAWHGLGLIAARAGEHAQAEQDLQKAVYLDPIDAAYLSDLGYARLCAGHVTAAHEPLAKAAQLEPSDMQAMANLALWALLDGDPQQADAIMQGAKLPQASRDAIRRLATRLRITSSSTNASSTATVTPVSHSPRQIPVATGISGIPGGVLDRFGPTSSTQGTNP
ncbi:tetratricopeptide repeat protein [Dyella sp. A6]|uniref:tetratricopeptide repeat protein n=1 Tax=Dyella aluminiiresistens TaxID=3069105 RepID=UPI002E784F42|nr:tetratricopeptide repeat protein [Dyella sp. A6]